MGCEQVTRPHEEPPGTLRRMYGGGFAHFIKLEQPGGAPCWDCFDSYGSMSDFQTFRTDDDMERANDIEVVYVPMSARDWREVHDG